MAHTPVEPDSLSPRSSAESLDDVAVWLTGDDCDGKARVKLKRRFDDPVEVFAGFLDVLDARVIPALVHRPPQQGASLGVAVAHKVRSVGAYPRITHENVSRVQASKITALTPPTRSHNELVQDYSDLVFIVARDEHVADMWVVFHLPLVNFMPIDRAIQASVVRTAEPFPKISPRDRSIHLPFNPYSLTLWE